MIIVWGSVETASEASAETLRLSLEHVRRSRKEPGCISHNVSVDAENSNRLNFFEEWQDIEALQRHFAVDESAAFAAQLTELALQPPELRIYEATRIR